VISKQPRFTFGDPNTYPDPATVTPKHLGVMHRAHGKTEGQVCGTCAHFERYHQSTRWNKCALTVQTSGPGTDWRVHWVACGKWSAKL
jgi:hypothetical protein